MSPREDDGLRREVPDEELVARVVAGDDRAFRELYLRHHAVITRRLRRLLGPRHDVEDVLQVTFVEAHRALRRFDAQRSFVAWLHGIALRQAANHLRKSRRWAWLRGRTSGASPADEVLSDDDALARVADPAALPEAQAMRRQLLMRLYEAMDTLPEKKRVAFSLHVLDGLGFVEIGELVEASPQTVRARVLSARDEVLSHLRRASRGAPWDLALVEQL